MKLREMINRRPEVGKWTIRWWIGPDYAYRDGWRCLEFGVFKTTSLPPEGGRFTRKHFRGFVVQISFLIPIRLGRW
jgi:hypothetical protein